MTTSQTTSSNGRLASDLFGGKIAVREAIFREIKEGFLREGFSIDQLSSFSEYPKKTVEAAFEDPKRKLTGELALSLMTPLGIALDKVLKLSKLVPKDREYWEKEFRPGSVSVEDAEGAVAQEGAGPTAPDFDIELGLFIRFRAIDEIN